MRILEYEKPYSVSEFYGDGETVVIKYPIPAGSLEFRYDGRENGSIYELSRHIGWLRRDENGRFDFWPNEKGKRFYYEVKYAFHI